MRPCILALPCAALVSAGCYHYSFDQRPLEAARSDRVERRTVEHEVRRPTWLNGFVGTGEVDTSEYCDRPVKTELRVTATDVLISVATLLIYTPHTLYITCPVERIGVKRQVLSLPRASHGPSEGSASSAGSGASAPAERRAAE